MLTTTIYDGVVAGVESIYDFLHMGDFLCRWMNSHLPGLLRLRFDFGTICDTMNE
jgi:hypothetical protein